MLWVLLSNPAYIGQVRPGSPEAHHTWALAAKA
jgi:hypothetical protein